MESAFMKDGMLVNEEGMTLYTNDVDTNGESTLPDAFLRKWPPYKAQPDDAPLMGRWTHFTRDDGTVQWAYDGKPLYTCSSDKNPGDTNGAQPPWRIAKPKP